MTITNTFLGYQSPNADGERSGAHSAKICASCGPSFVFRLVIEGTCRVPLLATRLCRLPISRFKHLCFDKTETHYKFFPSPLGHLALAHLKQGKSRSLIVMYRLSTVKIRSFFAFIQPHLNGS